MQRMISLLLALLSLSPALAEEVRKTPQKQYALGWRGDPPGRKVTPFELHPRFAAMRIAASSDLTPKMPPIWDQSVIGSCVGHGSARAFSFSHKLLTAKDFMPSRLMIYFNARARQGWQNQDSGCYIIDAVAELGRLGVCDEKLWVYDTRKVFTRPNAKAYEDAKKHQVTKAYKVDNSDGRSIRIALSNGFPVVFGSLVYSGIETLTYNNYVLPAPKKGERPIGGHCMTITGHSDADKLYLVDNSWGVGWGRKGRCKIPYDYIHNPRITEDCWVVEAVEK